MMGEKGKYVPLCDNVAHGPCAHLVPQLSLHQFYPEFGKVLGMGGPMQTQLHSDVNHHPTQHKSGIGRCTAGRKGPCAKQAECFHCVETLRDICQRTPDQPSHRASQRGHQMHICLIAPCANADDHPEKKGRSVVVFVRGGFAVKERQKGMIKSEESKKRRLAKAGEFTSEQFHTHKLNSSFILSVATMTSSILLN